MSVLMGIGTSAQSHVYLAGQEAANQMQSHLGGRPQLTLVFSSMRFADPKLLAGIRSVTENAPLIGCTGTGTISTWGAMRQSVVVIGLRGPGVSFVTGLAQGISKDPESAGRRLAQDLKASEPGVIKAALLFPDGLSRNGSALLRGAQQGLDPQIPIVGGSAGDDFYFQHTFQYFDEEVLTDSVPGALLCGDIAVGTGVRHGWIPLGRSHQITKSDGEVIRELDGAPAVTIYESYLGQKRGALARKPLAHVAMSYPLGLESTSVAENVMRSAVRIGEKGSLVCTGELPEGSWVRLMIAGNESILAAAAAAAGEAAEAIGYSRFKGALVFSSGARQRILGNEAQGEIDVIRNSLGGVGYLSIFRGDLVVI